MSCNLKYLVSAVAFAGAALVAYRGNDGWGWLIFAGILPLL